MAKAKLGFSEPCINKKFRSCEEAYMYGKRLKEYIRYNCKEKKRFAQAAIIISNTNCDYIIDSAYKPSNKFGRPKIEKKINFDDVIKRRKSNEIKSKQARIELNSTTNIFYKMVKENENVPKQFKHKRYFIPIPPMF